MRQHGLSNCHTRTWSGHTCLYYCPSAVADLTEVSKNYAMFKRLFTSDQNALSAPRTSCQTMARFSNTIELPIGRFVRDDEVIEFRRHQHFEEVQLEAPTACLAKVGPRSAEYLAGPVGSVPARIDKHEFFCRVLSWSQLPAPSRLGNLFNYRKKLNEWQYRSACPVFYELNDGLTQIYNRLMKRGAELSTSPGRYFDVTENYLDTLDLRKRNAGAARLLERNYLQVSNSQPLRDRFNFAPLAFHEHLRSIYFLPDAMVISVGFQNKFFYYEDVEVNIFENRYVTSEVPYGVQPIDYTWQYVNKNGGPDRRFNDNFQIPIIAVTELDLHFSDGTQVHTAFTDSNAVHDFGDALVKMGGAVR